MPIELKRGMGSSTTDRENLQHLQRKPPRPSRARVGSEDGQRCQFLLIVQYRECKHQFRAPRNPSIVHKHHPPTTSMSSFGVECRVDRYAGISVARHRSSAPSPSSIVTNKPSTSAAMRRAARCPQSAAQAADAGRAVCRSISHTHRCPRAPLGQSERDHRRSPQRN